ncbi:MAG: dipeptide/oligopeptide/nickel ABC transporter ATP-binding protein [Lachnospiraceae bacterium]|nr:dipeptide/oligopeptide/nickel ABC transporter ATP-binding protein [Lachnospiraceae bacterium]
MKPILEINNLTKTFVTEGKPDFTALDHVSFQLYPGETLGIVGESGSGKSTLAKTITRLIDATEGTVTLNGQDITRVSGKELRDVYKDIQMVFQTPVSSFDPRRTLGDGIGESLRNRGVSKKETEKTVLDLLEKCGLTAEFAGRYPHEVSGGQCQRAAIARALAIQPKILICDEATSALDVTVQQQIMELLKKLREENRISYLFICHNLGLVQSFCDRIVVMYEGKIVEAGTPDEVIMHPKSEYAKKLIESVF